VPDRMVPLSMALSDPQSGFQGHCIIASRISNKRYVLGTKLLKNANRKPCTISKLTCDLLTLKVVSKSRVTGAPSVPILVFLGLSVVELGPMYKTDVSRQTDVRSHTSDVRQNHRLMPPAWAGHNIKTN